MNANPSSATTGFIYLSPEFPQGQFMMTAEVVKSSCTPRGISYIETVDGYRFIVTAYDTKAMHSLTEFLAVNEDYFYPLSLGVAPSCRTTKEGIRERRFYARCGALNLR
nr:hypothetical protein [Escherichia coli]